MQAGFNPIIPPNIAHIDPDKFHEMEDWLEAEIEVRNQCFYWSQEVE